MPSAGAFRIRERLQGVRSAGPGIPSLSGHIAGPGAVVGARRSCGHDAQNQSQHFFFALRAVQTQVRGQRQFHLDARAGHIRHPGGIQALGVALTAHGLGHIEKNFHITGQMLTVPGMQIMEERNGGHDDRRPLTRQKTGQPGIGLRQTLPALNVKAPSVGAKRLAQFVAVQQQRAGQLLLQRLCQCGLARAGEPGNARPPADPDPGR